MAQLKLLFFDTFSHDVTDGVNLDLIQFNEVVVVQEMRIIPLGAKVEISSCGTRLGATNPSAFHVEAFVNNRNTTNPPTFQKIGSCEYNERNIELVMEKQCPTDCLIVKGYYSAITLAVYGNIMKDVPAQPQQPAALSSKPTQVTVKKESAVIPVKKEIIGTDVKPSVPATITSVAVVKEVTPPATQAETKVPSKAATSGSADSMNSQLYGGISSVEEGTGMTGAESDDQEMNSEEDVLAGDIITTDETGYDDGYDGYTELSPFNPYQFEVTPLMMFLSPALTTYTQERARLCDSETPTALADQLLLLIDKHRDLPHQDKWVQGMEKMEELISPALASLSQVDPAAFDSAVNTLIDWCLESLSVSAAMAQPETPYKVRHLKMGIKFTGRMFLLSNELTQRMLEMGVQQLLLGLFVSSPMATSLHLLIIKSLDMLTHTEQGMLWFIGESKSAEGRSGYQQLLDIALTKQNARIMVAISALLRKVHFYETLAKLRGSANKLAERTMSSMREHGSGEPTDPSIYSESAGVDDGEVDLMVSCLEEALSVLKHPKDYIAQPAQSNLPARKQYQVSHAPSDPYPGLFSMFSSCRILEVLLVLLSTPTLAAEPDVFIAIRDILSEMLKTLPGILYLSTNVDAINCIIRTLLQSAYDKDSECDENSAQTLGLELVYQLQALQYVDQLKENISRASESEEASVDDSELLAILHAMLGLTVTPQGRDALVNVLSLDMEPLLSLIDPCGDEELDTKVRLSTTAKYINDFIQLVLMYTADVVVIEPYIPKIIAVTKYEGSCKIFGGVLDWLEPYQDLSKLDHSCVESLAKLFHSYVDQLPKVEVGLLSCLRIMSRIGLPPAKPTDTGFSTEELCYQTALLEIYKEDCLNGWIKIIDKLSEKQLHSWQRGATMAAVDRDLLLFIIHTALTLIKTVTAQVIAARNGEYQDTTALGPLFRTFTVVCSVPIGALDSEIVTQIQKLIIDILALYTQPEITGTEAEINDAMSNSLWTCMVKQLLQFSISHPCNYLSGTLMLSELLPLPLPIQCNEALSEEEVQMNINHRTIWSAHLLPIASDMELYIEGIAGSSCLHLQHAFRRLCGQLADLNHHLAQFVTRCLLKAFTESLPCHPQAEASTTAGMDANPQSEDTGKKITYEADVISTNIVGILSYLVQQAPAKAALINSLRSRTENSTYTQMFNKMLSCLNTVSESSTHNQCQENIVSLLQSLCDVELSLVDDLDSVDIATQLANELPDAETHEKITLAFMEHIGNYDHCYTSVLLSLRTLVMFTDYDYTFRCLTRGLTSDSMSLYNLFTRLNNTFSKDSSDCISTLSTALQLLRLLVELENSPDSQRHQTVSALRLAQMVNWKVQPHPLDQLEKLLVDLVEDSLEGIVANITSINKILKSVDSSLSDAEPVDMDGDEIEKMPESASIQEQFSKRSIFVICDVDMINHSPAYWLTNLMADDSSVEEADDRVQADLVQLCEQNIKDFSLEEELKKVEAGLDNLAKVTIIHSRKNEVLALGQAGTEFKAPMRGLGVMRRGQQRGRISTRGGRDHFRDRAQNTSRPPSMHVDDFVKIAHVPSNEQSVTTFTSRDRGRGGFDRGRGRTRFPTVPDGFKPNFRGGFRGGSRGTPRGSPSTRGSYFHTRGGGHRFDDNTRFAGGRGGMMSNLRQERRTFSPQSSSSRYNGENPQSDRRSYTPRSGMSDSRGGMSRGRGMTPYYSSRDKNPRIGSTTSRDRDRPNHYRSYTK